MAITLGVGPSTGDALPVDSFSIVLTGTTINRGVVVLIAWEELNPAPNITAVDVAGQAATLVAGSKATLGSDHIQIAYLNNLSSGGDKTINVTFGDYVYAVGVAIEIAGHDTAVGVDATLTATDNTGLSNPITGTLTTATANAAIFALCTAAGFPSAGTNFTLLSNPRENVGFQDEDEYWLDAGAAGGKTVSFASADSGAFWLLSAVSIKIAGGGGGGRTAKNTRGWGLGTELGMGIWMPNEL
jgi:hypothetical protein